MAYGLASHFPIWFCENVTALPFVSLMCAYFPLVDHPFSVTKKFLHIVKSRCSLKLMLISIHLYYFPKMPTAMHFLAKNVCPYSSFHKILDLKGVRPITSTSVLCFYSNIMVGIAFSELIYENANSTAFLILDVYAFSLFDHCFSVKMSLRCKIVGLV